MPSSMPDAATLLKAAIRYLEDELMPELAGYHRFKCRVTVNALSTIRRELERGEDFGEREASRLQTLLGHSGDRANLSAELADQIRGGKIAPDDEALRDHIRESLREALAINNPKWIER